MPKRTRKFVIVGSKVREYRERAGLSQPELARRSGITQSSLSHIEAGRRNGSVPVNYALARELGVSLEAITVLAEPEAAAS